MTATPAEPAASASISQRAQREPCVTRSPNDTPMRFMEISEPDLVRLENALLLLCQTLPPAALEANHNTIDEVRAALWRVRSNYGPPIRWNIGVTMTEEQLASFRSRRWFDGRRTEVHYNPQERPALKPHESEPKLPEPASSPTDATPAAA